MFTTYILQSEKDGSYYIGSTDKIDQRVVQHNKGYSKYTKNKGPFNLVYKEEYDNFEDTRKREVYFKSAGDL